MDGTCADVALFFFFFGVSVIVFSFGPSVGSQWQAQRNLKGVQPLFASRRRSPRSLRACTWPCSMRIRSSELIWGCRPRAKKRPSNLQLDGVCVCGTTGPKSNLEKGSLKIYTLRGHPMKWPELLAIYCVHACGKHELNHNEGSLPRDHSILVEIGIQCFVVSVHVSCVVAAGCAPRRAGVPRHVEPDAQHKNR